MADFHLLNNVELLNEFNAQMSVNATLIHETNFHGDIYDNYEWSFYEKTPKKNVYNLLGFYRKGDYFPQEGFTNSLSSVAYTKHPTVEVCPIAVDRAVHRLSIPWRSSCFESRYFYNGLPSEFDRYWIDEESLIQEKFPDKWEKINQLCLQEIKRLAWIGKTKDYKSTWVYHKYKDSSIGEIINSSILNDTCFYYSPLIFYNRFSSPFMYFSSKEKQEFDRRFWYD